MLKIPFIQHTGVGIEITEEMIRWVEVDRFGKRMKLFGSGEILHNNGEVSFKGAIEQLLKEVKADAVHIAISIPEALIEVLIEDIPYTEEPEDIEEWVQSRLKELSESYDCEQFQVQYHIIQIDEDNYRCLFQILNDSLIDRYTEFLSELDIFPQYISSGLLEAGYSQILNPEFVDGISSIIQKIGSRNYLVIYEYGQVKNLLELNETSSEESEYLLKEADSYLLSEESSTDQPPNSIALYTNTDEEQRSWDHEKIERSVGFAIPLKTKKELKGIASFFSTASGLLIKLFFKDLDGFNYAKAKDIESGILHHDKKESIRLGILLFVPLIFFGLLSYAFGKVVDHQLIESNQIMNQIGDKIDEVTGMRENLIETRDRFTEARSIVENQHSIAYIFEEIGKTIPEDIWLIRIVSKNKINEKLNTSITGYSRNELSLAEFLSRLEQSEYVEQSSLIVSEKVEASTSNRSQPNEALIGSIRFELDIQFNR